MPDKTDNRYDLFYFEAYVFFLIHGEDGRVEGFGVSSDYDRNKSLYRVSLEDWLKYIDFIAMDDIVAMDLHFSKEKNDYIITKKERVHEKQN